MTDIAGERARLAAQGLNIIYRETWGSRLSYTSARAVKWPADYLFLHITVTAAPAPTPLAEQAACRTVEDIGQQRFGIGWSYNAGAMQSGRLYEGQPLTRRGAHTVNDKPNPSLPSGSLNEEARALAIVQNVNDQVTDAQIDAAARWGAALRRSGEARRDARWYGHRDVTAKSCPGPIAYARLPELQRLTDHYTANGLGPAGEDEDMPVVSHARDARNGAMWEIVNFSTRRWLSSQRQVDISKLYWASKKVAVDFSGNWDAADIDDKGIVPGTPIPGGTPPVQRTATNEDVAWAGGKIDEVKDDTEAILAKVGEGTPPDPPG